MSSLLYLVRHGETEWNRQQRIQGSTDIPLNETGRAQALATGRVLAALQPDGIIASPLQRAFETAEIIAATLGLVAPTPDPELVERRYGAAEGLYRDQIEARFPDRSLIPGHESDQALADRSLGAMLHIARAHSTRAVVVVAHGGLIRSVLEMIDPGVSHGHIRNGSVHGLRFTGHRLSLVSASPLARPPRR